MLHLALSQAEYGHAILQDIGLICVVAVLLAGALHAFVRRSATGLEWNQIGKVSTAGIVPLDIFASVLLTLPFALKILLPLQEPVSDVSAFLIAQSFAILSLMAVAVCYIFKVRGMLPEALGLRPKHPFQVVAWAIGAYILMFLMLIGLSQLGLEDWLAQRLGEKQNQDVVDELINAEHVQKQLVLILGACVIAPVVEEIVFRGYLYPVVKRFTDPIVAALFTGIIFGAIHGEVWAVIPLSLFGVLLAVLYEKSGSIWACILCHALFNSVNVFFMLNPADKL